MRTMRWSIGEEWAGLESSESRWKTAAGRKRYGPRERGDPAAAAETTGEQVRMGLRQKPRCAEHEEKYGDADQERCHGRDFI